MRVIRTIRQMQTAALASKRAARSIGLVPTMGALHEGHASLISACRKENDIAVVSIFVNPIQFGPSEDFKRYPRPVSQDMSMCKKAGVDYVFHPSPQDMYPSGFKTYVDVQELGDALCGAFRQGHFTGVATVVNKLLNMVIPTRAYFGLKDFQQARVIEKMISDLNLNVEFVGCATVRESDGLVCPASWKPGAKTLKPGLDLVGKI